MIKLRRVMAEDDEESMTNRAAFMAMTRAPQARKGQIYE